MRSILLVCSLVFVVIDPPLALGVKVIDEPTKVFKLRECKNNVAMRIKAKGLLGEGTAASPYQISTPAQLMQIAGSQWQCAVHFRLDQNIDLSSVDSFPGIDAIGIVFDGNGKVISNLKSRKCSGLFTTFDTLRRPVTIYSGGLKRPTLAEVRDVVLLDFHLVPDPQESCAGGVGTVAAKAYGDVVISNVSVRNATIVVPSDPNLDPFFQKNSQRIGGIFGNAGGGLHIVDSSFQGVIQSLSFSGSAAGLVGDLGAGTIERSFAQVNITFPLTSRMRTVSPSRASGLVGFANTDSHIFNSYAVGTLTGSSVSGLVSYISASIRNQSPSVVIHQSYAAMKFNFGHRGRGHGLVGGKACTTYSDGSTESGECDDIQVTSSFWDQDLSGVTHSSGGRGKSTAEMYSQNTFNDNMFGAWNFDDVWRIHDGIGYPSLR